MTEPAPAAEVAAEAPAESAEAEPPLGAPPVLSMVGMGGLLVVSIVLAMVSAPLYTAEVGPLFENPQDVGNAAVYLVAVVAFTALLLIIARRKLGWVIQLIILGAVAMSLVYLFGPLLSAVLRPAFGDAGVNAAWGLGLVLSLGLAVALKKHPEWWLVDTVGVGLSAVTVALFGISFGTLPSIALLAMFAAYDAIAVYRTKHMIALADSVMDLRLPIMLIVPKQRGYSFLKEEARLKEKLEKGEPREALFMGLGDVVIPGVLVVSALTFLPAQPLVAAPWITGNLVVALATLVGIVAGYAVLMTLVAKGKAHAGLPSLNGGAIAGFLLAGLPLYGAGALLTLGF